MQRINLSRKSQSVDLAVVHLTRTVKLKRSFLNSRYGSSKTTVAKAVFTPLTYMCSSESYSARTWLENHYKSLETYYNKYMRSFPSVLMNTNNDIHLEIEKKCSLSFQNIMKTLKSKGQIVSSEEHSKAATKLKEQTTLTSVYKMLNQNTQNSFKVATEKKLNNTPVKKKQSKPSNIYNSIIQYNFGKLNIVQGNPVSAETAKPSTPYKRDVVPPSTEGTHETIPDKAKAREKKSRIAIKEVQVLKSESKSSVLPQTDLETSRNSFDKPPTTPEEIKLKLPKTKFSEGYRLFKMDDEAMNCDSDSIAKQVCDWLDSSPSNHRGKLVSDEELSETMKQLEEIFNRIVDHYKCIWERQRNENYCGAKGSYGDLQKLVSVLPALENYHLEKLTNKWDRFCKQIKEHARKNYVVYGAMVSDMQLFLLEFEEGLEKRNFNIKVEDDDDESSVESYLDTEEALKQYSYFDVDVLSDGKPVECLINKKGLSKLRTNQNNGNADLDTESGMINPSKIVDFLIENEGCNSVKNNVHVNISSSIWNDTSFKTFVEENPDQKLNCIKDIIDTSTNVQISEVLTEVNKDNIKVTEEKKEESSKSEQNTNKTDFIQKILQELKEIETNISKHDKLSPEVESKVNVPETKSKLTVLTKNKDLKKNEDTSENKMDKSRKSVNCTTTEVPKIKFETLPR